MALALPASASTPEMTPPAAVGSPAPVAPSAAPDPGVHTSCRLPGGAALTTHHPAPPSTFDASTIRWIGNQRGYRREQGIAYGDQVWVGGLDGSALRLVRSDGVMAARRVPGGSIAAVLGEDVAEQLVTIDATGTAAPFGAAHDSRFAVDRAGTSAFVWRTPDTDGAVGDVWRVPLDGSPAEVMLTSVRAPEVIFSTPDGSSVAIGRPDGDAGPYWTIVRSGDHPTLRLKNLVPLGFDAGGRLLAVSGLEVIRIDPRTGRRSRLATPLTVPPRSDTLVTPRGRTLVVYDQNSADAAATLLARNLATGRTRTWRLPRDAEWYLTDLGTSRYVVLGRDTDLFTTEWAVVDLAGGWLGFVSFCPPAAAPTASASPSSSTAP
jgi:hypothetical protein